MIWALILGYLMFGEVPTAMIVLGSAIIAGAGLFVIWREHQLALAHKTAAEVSLTGPDDNTFCDHCHTTPWAGGSYAGTRSYDGSAHGSGSATIWPGPYPPPRTEADAPGKCLNCHDPHGWEDADGMIPRLTIGREEVLCL